MVISPKVYVPVLIQLVAAVALALITGDKTLVIGLLTGAATTAGFGAAAPPAPAIKMADLVPGGRIPKRRRRKSTRS